MLNTSEQQRYTEVMEKGLQQSHGVGHEEYLNNLDKKLAVERAREKDYQKNQALLKELNSSIHR
ncbi:hypothetical protein [Bacillus sp. FJAT-45037]|uniref:hypothetical protein n=1 Tax=Bacillus sp. FJAT-45037 TaxID=2011007 RepID=UPI000C24EE44|nr:hypothetical protein [Bacillus sp. FJAT-45037]